MTIRSGWYNTGHFFGLGVFGLVGGMITYMFLNMAGELGGTIALRLYDRWYPVPQEVLDDQEDSRARRRDGVLDIEEENL